MKKTVILLIVISTISKIIGFSRDIVLAYFYGASNISDAYIISMTIPTLVVAIIGNSIIASYIPLYTKLENKEGTARALKFTNNLINLLMFLCIFIVGIGLIFTEQIIEVIASGFEVVTMRLATKMTRVTLFGVFFSSLISVFQSFLQMKGDYLTPSLILFPFDLIMILSIIVSSQKNIMILSYGFLIAKACQCLFLVISSKKKQFKFKLTMDFNDSTLKSMFFLILPIIIGIAVNDVNNIIDKTLASQIIVGGISALNYAQKLNGFIQGVVVASIGTVMYPLISRLAMQNNTSRLKKVLSEAIVGTSALVLPSMMGIMFLSEPIILFLFGRGAFENQAIKMTSLALFYYSIGMIGIALREILSKPFYSLEDTKTPMVNSIIGVVINIILNFVLSRFLGIGGLALATSISAIVTAFLMYLSLRKKIGSFENTKISTSFIKVLLVSIFMGVIVRLSYDVLFDRFSNSISLMVSIIIGIGIYLITVYYIKVEELDMLFKSFKVKMFNLKE